MANDKQIDSEIVDIPKGEVNDLMDLVTEKQLTRTKSQALASVPSILLPYQARWHMDNSVVRLAEKSRRIGFSWGCLAAEGTLEAARADGMNQYYMGYNLGMAAENIGDAIKFAQVYGVAVSNITVHRERETMKAFDAELGVLGERKQDVTRYKITFKSGFVYESLSSAPWNWRGRQGHARIDEGAFHRDLMEVIKGALAFRLWGGRIDVVSSHNGEDNDFNLLVRDIEAGKIPWSKHKIDFDQALADGLYQRICLVRGIGWTPELERSFRQEAFDDYPDQADANEELLCIPKKGSGVYMPRFLIESCQDKRIPTLRLAKDAAYVMNPFRLDETDQWCRDNIKPIIDNMRNDKRSVYGQDFGRSGDLSDIWIGQEETSNYWRVSFAIELRNLPFDVQARIRDYVIDNLPHFYHASFDARGNGQQHAESAKQRYGEFRISCVMATVQFYAEWFPKYKSAYEGKYITAPAGEDIVTDHRRVILMNGKPTMDAGRDKGSDGGYRHGDSAIAGLMFWHSANQEGQPSAGTTIESNTDNFTPERMQGRKRSNMFKRI
jgi:phage FluMu gp28-like protein